MNRSHLLLGLLAIVLIALFCSLGFWQLHRAQVKEKLLNTIAMRQAEAPVQSLHASDTLEFRRGTLSGHWVPHSWILLDNTIHEKKLGYEVYALFQPEHDATLLLVDLGFTLLYKNRHTIPLLPTLSSQQLRITGLFAPPPRYFALGGMVENIHQRPLKIQYVHLGELKQVLHLTMLHPLVFVLDQPTSSAFKKNWVAHTIPPEKHRGYALQWFAIAFTLLLLFVSLHYLKR